MKINLPFLPEFEEAMLSGRKRATSRTRKFGNVGDTFVAFGCTFTIMAVNRLALSNVANIFWRLEGVESPDDFIAIWRRIHPRQGWQPTQNIYFHQFERIDG